MNTIEKADISLKPYNGTIIEPIGVVRVIVKYKSSTYLVKEKGPPILSS